MADGETECTRGGTRCVGRDRRGHRHGGRDAGLPAGPLRPHGCCSSRKGARHCPGRQERFAPRCRNWPSRWRAVPQRPTTTPWPGPDAQPMRSKTSAGASRDGLCRSSAAGRGDPRPSMAWSASDFSSDDFTPRQNFRDPGDSTVPDAWPVTYDQMRPWYAEAEKLLRVRGQPDPLRPEAAEVGLPAAPPFSRRQPAAGRLSDRPRIASLSPADGL